MRISAVKGYEVIDSRGYPTVAAMVKLGSGAVGKAIVPSGASVGKNESIELRDGDRGRWLGKGVLGAVKNVNNVIAPKLRSQDADVRSVDRAMLELDGTENKANLGANAILAVSLANARAVASERGTPLYVLISDLCRVTKPTLPTPMVNILSGGLHARRNIDMQDFLVIPHGASSFREAIDYVGRVYHAMRLLLQERGFTTLLADEGGFGPSVASNEEMLKLLLEAIHRAKLKAGLDGDAAIGIDVASSHFWTEGKYHLNAENLALDGSGLVDILSDWCRRYPVISIEDGCAEDDWSSWKKLTEKLGREVQLVGDDVFTTNTVLIRRGIDEGVGNAALIKLNQIGTLSETLDAIELCKENGYVPVVSARSGDSEDDFIADLAVGTAAGQIKVGSIARSERTAKYNRLLEIEQLSGERGEAFSFSGRKCFPIR